MMLHKPNNNKLMRSLGISSGAVIMILVLQYLFPQSEWTEVRTAVLTAIGAWLINTVRESLK